MRRENYSNRAVKFDKLKKNLLAQIKQIKLISKRN